MPNLDYWQQQLSVLPPALELPSGLPTPLHTADLKPNSDLSIHFDSELSAALQQLASTHNQPLSQVLYTGLLAVCCRYTQQEDVLINWQSSDPSYHSPLPICFSLSLTQSFSAALTQFADTIEQSLNHYTDRTSILSALPTPTLPVLHQLYCGETLHAPDKFNADLMLNLSVVDEAIHAHLRYHNQQFDASALQRLAGHWQTLLQAACEHADTALSQLPLLTEAEWQQQVVLWNQAATAFTPAEGGIHQFIERHAAQQPDKLALLFEHTCYSFRELNAAANRVAHHLLAQGVTANTLVGVCFPRTPNMVISILAVLKAGAAYVPLDPSYPRQRLDFIVANTCLSLLLTESTLQDHLPSHQAQLLLLDTLAESKDSNPDCAVQASDLAYIMYTSGSTGTPKGVMVNHACLNSYVQAMRTPLQLQTDSVYLHTASFGFSASVRQLFVPLCNGVPIVLASLEQRADPQVLFGIIQQQRITNVDFAPSYWRHCLNRLLDLPSDQRQRLLNNRLRLILSSAEPLWSDIPAQWQQRLGHKVTCLNMYGQTETVGMVTGYEVPAEWPDAPLHAVSIGKPLANVCVYVLDSFGQPVPIGVKGELHVGGVQIAQGYWHLPEKTEKTFLPNPFVDDANARICNTGDLVRFNATGNIEFIGRQDNQVKIRGFRIELGEVEMILATHPKLNQVVVLAHEVALDDKRLVAHIIPSQSLSSLNANQRRDLLAELRQFAHAQLLPYMVPSAWLLHESYPRLPNGKLDRCVLMNTNLNQLNQHLYVAPRTQQEETLAVLWRQILNVTQVGIEDNFFELGGHSLSASKLMAVVNETFNVELPVLILFGAPTIAELAQRLEQALNHRFPSLRAQTRPEQLPLSSTQQRLWFLDQLQQGNYVYNMLAAFRFVGHLQVEGLQRSLNLVTARHEILRTVFRQVQDGTAEQVILDRLEVQLPVVDLRSHPVEERIAIAQQLCLAEAQYPFDLTHAPLWRVQLFQIADQEYVWCLVMHHIISDKWSFEVLLQETLTAYAAYVQAEAPTLPELPLQYADFALWQQQLLQQGAFAQQEQYWQQRLAGAPPLLEMPTDFPRPEQQRFEGAYATFKLSSELSRELKQLSRQEGVTLFMTLLTAFNVLLYRYTEQEDILVGLPVAYRNFPVLEPLIGFFANTVVVRTDLSGTPSFRTLLQRVKQRTLEAYAHQDVPFARIVEVSRPARSTGYNPLFQIMISFLDWTWKEQFSLPEVQFHRMELHKQTTDFDLFLTLFEQQGQIRGAMGYDIALFRDDTVQRLLEHFQCLLENVVQQPETAINELSLLSITEQQIVLAQAQQLEENQDWESFEL